MSDQPYIRIAENFDRGIQTAPKAEGELSKAFIEFLKIVYNPEEAELVQHLPALGSKKKEELAKISGFSEEKVGTLLGSLSKRAAVEGRYKFRLPGPATMLNLHVFYPEIREGDLEAAKLYQQFFIKEGYHQYYATSAKGTPVMRSIPINEAIHPETKILTAEEAHDFVERLDTEDLALVPCPCRTRTEKLGIRECSDKFPVASCVFVGPAANRFEKIGLGKRITKKETIEYIDESVKMGLIPNTGNSIEGPFGIICMCCGCCCSNVRGRTRFDNPTAVRPANFIPVANDDCALCETCVDQCLLDALSINEDEGKAEVDSEKCLGCGVCAVACPEDALKLHRYERSEPSFQTAIDLITTIANDNDRP
ncbi:MAG: 4Fe-4S dicluster domain-containing protein [Proteobacteria bacterium]|nr:4Fe-4S dicluster domain-containing protein [Pseudomonadota bacterium]